MISQQLAQPECAQDAGSWCARVFQLTRSDLLARYSDVVLGSGLRILVIILLAVLARLVLHRMIHRLTRVNSEGAAPKLMRPLRDRDPDAQQNAKKQLERRAARARTIGSVLRSATTLVIYGVATTMVLGELGINLGPIIASAGIVGLALGFGAQNLVKDFLSGMFMMVEDQYGVGDWVNLGEASGTVEAVGMRVTTVRDANGTVWYVRNGEVLRVGNSSQGHAVAVVDLPVKHGTDIPATIDLVRRTATELTAENTELGPDVLEPPEMLGIESISQECVTLRLTVKVRTGRQYAVQRALLAGIMSAITPAEVRPSAATDSSGTDPAATDS